MFRILVSQGYRDEILDWFSSSLDQVIPSVQAFNKVVINGLSPLEFDVVTISHHALIFVNFFEPTHSQKFDFQAVGGHDHSEGIETWSPKYGVVGQRSLDDQEVYLNDGLEGVASHPYS